MHFLQLPLARVLNLGNLCFMLLLAQLRSELSLLDKKLDGCRGAVQCRLRSLPAQGKLRDSADAVSGCCNMQEQLKHKQSLS